MEWIWQPLIGNLAVSALTISVWLHIKRHLHVSLLPFRNALFGALLGLGAVVTMIFSVEVHPGVHFDLRTSLIAIAALFGGPVAALLSILPAAAFRLYMGGEGAVAGITLLVAGAIMGLCGHFWSQGRPVTITVTAILAAGVAAFTLMSLQLIPAMHQGFWLMVALPSTLLSFAATVLVGYSMIVARKEAAERDILAAALNQAPDFTYIKDRHGRYVAVNLATAKFHGFVSASQMVGLTDKDIVGEQQAEKRVMAEQQAMTTDSAISGFEEIMMDENGEDRWYTTSKAPLHGPDGSVIGITGVTRDITRDKQIAADLQESRDRLNQMLNEMEDGIAVFHTDGTLQFSNDRYRDLFPLTKPVRRPGMDLRDILHAVQSTGEQLDLPEDRASWVQRAMDALKCGGDEQVHMDDGRWLNVRTRKTDDLHAIVIVSDITQAKSLELDLRSSTEKWQHLAEFDGLTDLPNRRSFDAMLEKEVARTERSGSPLSLLMIDVDRFKAYNDTYGHVAGDACLTTVANCLRSAVGRPMDMPARYGGEEFAIILPDTDQEGARHVATAVQHALRQAAILHKTSELGRVTVSIGVSGYGQDQTGRSTRELILTADGALYRAKSAGRNRVQSAAIVERATKAG